MNIFEKIYQKAKTKIQKIVLPEGDDLRVIQAASYLSRKRLAQIILLGKAKNILPQAKQNNLDIGKVEIIDWQKDKKIDDYIQAYWKLRKGKGLSRQQARDLLFRDALYSAVMMLREQRVDGLVAGAYFTTSNVARAILRCIEMDPAYATASGSFLVEVKERQYGEGGLFLFADCAIVPRPSAEQLADIALSSCQLWTKVTGYQPRVAMLSFSSRGSGPLEVVERVRAATEMVRKKAPQLIIDGELQADSAVVPEVAGIKVPDSPLRGRANILIFPNLEAGNISYKLMQRLGSARVVGPLIQGVARACSDLSRGCNSREIIDAVAVTAVRAQ